MMRRRSFLISFAAASALPRLARAQARLPRVAFLGTTTPEASTLPAFLRGMQELGHRDGRDFELFARHTDGISDRVAAVVAEIAGAAPAVVVTSSLAAIRGLMQATGVPIVAVLPETALAEAIGDNFAHPKGNVTGVIGSLAITNSGKPFELLKQAFPSARRIAYFSNVASAPENLAARAAADAAATAALGVEIVRADVRVPNDIAPEFERVVSGGPDAVLFAPDPMFTSERRQIVTLAAASRVPTMTQNPAYVDDGGLIAWGQDGSASTRNLADYVVKILNGAKPGDLPVGPPTYVLALNLKTARELGISFAPSIIALADRVIE